MIESRAGPRAYLFAGVYGRLVAHDVFLDGNTWRDSARVRREPLVGDLQAGLAGQWDDVSFAYTYVARSSEFEGQKDAQRFGALTITRAW